ncbi:hypothetical protein SAMN05216456_1318 [Devosia crocina]|uniref:Uncharacterized protein n=1 Tax=Devosia crocina TaxID=429728 RepID=A0A1I7N9L0_9HYPH|nr:hypothetical protein [Devosia crocina]SFV31365.1 hypothetical protein SAMN05216456_1318 [Devosia crocina]
MSSMLGVKTKRPNDVLDYDVDIQQAWLEPGDIVDTATAVISGGTAEINNTVVSNGVVRVWVAGGAVGETNTVTITLNTSQGRTKEVAFQLRIAMR